MESFDIIEKGGVVMIALLGLSVYVLGVVFYKGYQFWNAGIFQTSFIDHAMRPIKNGELTESLRVLAPVRSPVARMMRVSVECIRNREMSSKSREAEISRVGSQELRYLESHLRGLELAASTGPLLGLLGTVTGMVSSFHRLADAGSRVDPSMLAGGIWEALLTTAAGLVVAIPALAAYYVLDGMIEKVRSLMKDVTVQILALEDRFLLNGDEQRRVDQDRELELERQRLNAHESQRRELEQREEALRHMIDEQEKAITSMRTAPQGTSTLRLLNPTYTRF